MATLTTNTQVQRAATKLATKLLKEKKQFHDIKKALEINFPSLDAERIIFDAPVN